MSTASRLMQSTVNGITPHLVVRDAAEAISFYEKAFGAVEIRRSMAPDGEKVMFAEVAIGNGRFYLNDEFPDWGVYSPLERKGTAVTMHLQADVADPIYERAVAAGLSAKNNSDGERTTCRKLPLQNRIQCTECIRAW